MYISEVSGHHNATLAIEEAFRIARPEVEVLNINAFNYTNPISEKVINRLYMGMIKRTPLIWDYLYDNPLVVKRLEKIKETIHRFNSPKLKNLFERFKPHAVVCTQAFPCGMVADFKTTYRSDLPLFAVLTDYVPHSYWIYDNIDHYVVPSEEVAQRLVQKGVTREKIRTLGIPFDPKFTSAVEKERVIARLGLDPRFPILLIMGGGQGFGPIKTVVKSLDRARAEFQEVIVTGVNKKLYRALKRRAKKLKKKTVILGYVDYIHELMSVSDMIITKPGGITTAEALTKRLPMVIVRPIPGQEANNTAYLIEKGAAVKVDDVRGIGSVVERLLTDPGRLKAMREAAARISKPHASMDIARLIFQEARVYKSIRSGSSDA